MTDKDIIREQKVAENEAEMPSNDPKQSGRWYVVHTYAGHENKAKEALMQRVESLGLEEYIFEVIIPTRNVIQVRRGKKSERKERLFPGYILVRMHINDNSWLAVKTTPGVTAFVGAGSEPKPISNKEVDAIRKFMDLDAPMFKVKFSVGEAVKINDGPFAEFLGTIKEIDEEKGKVSVLVSIFGRETPVDLDFLQISKL
ncbi:transcription termination/antitermination protein NusG [Candidatus Roizmanbacteria bacterium CG22_combo_CG10-13_8_21_14_all_38_20]|uniref:Transcription termination/antitermination protein NusG n=1 Tax=Candidatus Roizmanbacteria bacterium CG22_combo_CG10-13_8_21_14_all_38_20 TaxID=1974862 RepID=A0A2H0BWN0_9BACT|nr:transcription termination/antitermination factor NusG [Candidatus Microgenomates bacterium]PIP61460.1 MAG: transcription termination/antitermination protein NusG [Candidatus Roizmanbacteria bacterium CG22_combo_CG10-13_8_21_14_all_38_20]PJC30687.1 MAG: transcription termination/antitermination protein NusG [Candidatus Roizmanbacteria bacterium CG_4_9_14_0_2_um_filter_38_17]